MTAPHTDTVIEQTQRWLADVVVGLNLCPFAKPVIDAQRLQMIVSKATDADALVADLDQALAALNDTGPDTTLVILPNMLADFGAFNDFLDIADALLEARARVGEIQIATFHPQYQFADVAADDISHYTNRSPYPMLHLLREADVADAVAAHPDPDGISERNIARLQALTEAQRRELLYR